MEDHYECMVIQPIEYITANNLGFLEGNVIKYISRYKQKGGYQDLMKAKDYLEILMDDFRKNPIPIEQFLEQKKESFEEALVYVGDTNKKVRKKKAKA